MNWKAPTRLKRSHTGSRLLAPGCVIEPRESPTNANAQSPANQPARPLTNRAHGSFGEGSTCSKERERERAIVVQHRGAKECTMLRVSIVHRRG